jgi:PAS domain S-box-containing protein
VIPKTRGLPVVPGDPAVLIGDSSVLMDALSQAHTGIIISERVGSGGQYRTIYVNGAFEAVTGYRAEEIMGRGCGFLQGSERQQPAVDEMRRAIAEGRTCRVVVRNFRKDGRPFWNAMTLTPITNASGEITHYLGVQQDVTDAYEGLERLSRSEALLREAQSIAHVGSWELDYRTGELRWSEEAYLLFGYVPGSVKPSVEAFLASVHPEDRAAVQAEIEVAARRPDGLYMIEHRILGPDGVSRVLREQGRVSFDAEGVPIRIAGVSLDITERNEAEQELLRREAMERELRDLSVACLEPMDQSVDQVIDGVLARVGRFTRSDRTYVFRRDAIMQTASNTHEWCADGIDPMIAELQDLPLQIAPRALRQLVSGEAVVVSRVADLDDAWASERALFEMQGIRSVLLVPMLQGGRLEGFVGFDAVREEHLWTPPEVRFLGVFAGLLMSAISRDRINVDLAAARQRETIGYLSSGVAHDLNNVLGVLDINIRYLHQKFSDGSDDPEVGQVLEEIHSALGQAKVVASGMLSLGRGGRMHPQDVPLGATIEEVVGICRPILPKSIQVQVQLPSDLVVLSQAGFLQAAVLNLILNARDAMPDGGMLTLDARRVRWEGSPELRVGHIEPGEHVALRVADNGAGMSPDTLERMFEPLFSTKIRSHGHGLGMYMVHEFVLGSGAGLSVESRIGKGTEFVFLLPEAKSGALATATPLWTVADAEERGARVLVVDDDPLIRASLSRQLHTLGIQCVAAKHGNDCLKIMERDQAFDLVLSDISMPELDGLELLRILFVKYPGLPVVLMTGHDPSLVLVDTLPGAPLVLRKPLGIPELRAALMPFELLSSP